jgi:hypothetical protein
MRDNVGKTTIHFRQSCGGQAENAPFSDCDKIFQADLKTFGIASRQKKSVHCAPCSISECKFGRV